jgi:neutral ceramidase
LIKKILRGLLYFVAALILLVAAMIGSIDRTPLKEQEFYSEMMTRLDTTRLIEHPLTALKSGWAKVNITPSGQSPIAGYVPRDHYDTVHDSLYARIILLDNGSFRCAMINVDLLIFPPALRDKLQEKLKSENIFLYLSATHTHNGAGGWDNSLGGRLITGKYSEAWLDSISTDIVDGVRNIKTVESSIGYFETDGADLVENRVDADSGKIDGMIRGFRLVRSDDKKAILFTYAAHATSIQKEMLDLSADYPGRTVSMLEEKYDFGMFMSGMVGSTRFKFTQYINYQFIDIVSTTLVEKIEAGRFDSLSNQTVIRNAIVPVEFGPSQLRIGKNWKLNNWAFKILLRKLKGDLTYLEVGNMIFIGTPCDFSGEIYVMDSLDALAASKGKQLIITSFNGDYDGYITYDKHYDQSSKEEINALNWVGPYYGTYFTEVISTLLDK